MRLPTWHSLFTGALYLFMYLPLLVLGLFSFNGAASSATWEGFSLRWYQQLFQDDRILGALQNSLLVGGIAVLLSSVLGTLMAVGLARYEFWGKSVYRAVAALPLVIPDIAIAVATLIFLATLAVPLSLWTVIAAHTAFCLAYVAVAVSTRLKDINPHLEEAALDLGANPVQAFVWVLLPQLLPGIVAGGLMAFVLSLDDLLIASFTTGAGATTIPIEIFSRVRTGVKPDINALSVLLIGTSALLAALAEYVRYREQR